jgi:ubiquinone/menaquinone biosynthesis C-methylase UbiE
LRKHRAAVEGRRVLDLGCGHGGYARALATEGARVIGFDLEASPLFGLNGEGEAASGITLVAGDATRLPFTDGSIQGVFCASLIEHVEKQERLIDEILRVLEPGGWCYLSFPPFYSPRGGHQFAPFHLLGEPIALWMYRWRRRAPLSPKVAESYQTAFGSHGLTPTTVGRIAHLLTQRSVVVEDVSTRFFDWLPIDPARVPLVREVLTWHVQFLIRRASHT